ncbi:hypothetical protein BGZ63DRAFT_371242 [Mariannaea sp. PMI_226]|nr:hypothetical protein BGZ63DRAFT_371242 [Mariannaea sp. PMI_226]
MEHVESGLRCHIAASPAAARSGRGHTLSSSEWENALEPSFRASSALSMSGKCTHTHTHTYLGASRSVCNT